MDRKQLQDRYRGVLLASAAGDALGATVEFMSREAIQERYGVHRDITGGGWLNLEAGEVTDDTQMALCIARSIVEQGVFDPSDIASRFVDWYRSNPPDIGNTTVMSLRALDAGRSWDEAGSFTHAQMNPRDASNGSVMRCAPVALYARGDSENNALFSGQSSVITHANPLSVEGCVALNAGIAALLDDPDADAAGIAAAATTNEDVKVAVQTAPGKTRGELLAGGYVLSTIQSSFWAVANHSTLEEAIVAAVNLGDDTDTTGAVTGALAGARWGASNIPDRWLAVLKGQDELVDLADQLLELSLNW